MLLLLLPPYCLVLLLQGAHAAAVPLTLGGADQWQLQQQQDLSTRQQPQQRTPTSWRCSDHRSCIFHAIVLLR
jgi:hypothetical protein